MRDVAAIRRWFSGLVLLEELEDRDHDLLAARAEWLTLDAGEVIHDVGVGGDGLWFLVEGDVLLGGAEDEILPTPTGDRLPLRDDGVVLRRITTPGYPVGWDGAVWPHRYRWRAVAGSRVRLLHIGRRLLDTWAREEPGLLARLSRVTLWIAGQQLRRQHTRLVTSRYDDEVDAVGALVASRAPELRVTSPLHRIPAYLRSRPTVEDAFRVLEVVRDTEDRVESDIARQALQMLTDVRRDLRVYLGLQRVYEAVAAAPVDASPERVRTMACRALIDLFDLTDHRIEGLEHLPDEPGSIVISNHLASHRDNQLPNRFTLILDTHFVASMILFRHHGRAPVRVVRDSHPDEAGHQRYYDRLGYVMVPSAEGGPLSDEERAARWHRFVAESEGVLRAGLDLMICPEGRVGPTSGSPRRMRVGAFRLAASIEPEPLIVPVAVANFDERLSRTTLGALVAEPFRLSEVVDDPTDRSQLQAFVNDDLTPRYRSWVASAAASG